MRNRSVTLILAAVLVAAILSGIVFSSWQMLAVGTSIVMAAWLTWISRRLHITASEVRQIRPIVDDSIATLRRIEAAQEKGLAEITSSVSSSDYARQVERCILEAIEACDSRHKEIRSDVESLRSAVTGGPSAGVDDILRAVEHVQTVVEGLCHRTATLEDLMAQLYQPDGIATLERLVEQAQAGIALQDKSKRQIDRLVRRQVEVYGMVEILEASLTARVDQYLDEIRREMRKATQAASSTVESPLSPESGNRDADNSIAGNRRPDFDLQEYLYYLSYHIPREIEAQQQLERTYRPEGLRPLLGGWALTPSGMLDIAEAVTRDSPGVVVECGSGTSTMWIALALRANGGGHVYALEHEPHFAEETRKRLASQGLSDYATVVDSPIIEQPGPDGAVEWYDLSGIGAVDRIDILVVDGPPEALGDLREHALGLLSARFHDGTRVFADDVNREGEQRMLRKWQRECPELTPQTSSTPVQAHLLWSTGDGD